MKSYSILLLVVGALLFSTGTGSPVRAQSSTNVLQRVRGETVFVGTIESINASNRTIQVSGVESVLGWQAVARTTTASTTKPKRSLQAVGQVETRTFDVNLFCKIEKEGVDSGKMGVMRPTLADLETGGRVAIAFTRGVGKNYTAKHIQPISMLDAQDVAPLPKK